MDIVRVSMLWELEHGLHNGSEGYLPVYKGKEFGQPFLSVEEGIELLDRFGKTDMYVIPLPEETGGSSAGKTDHLVHHLTAWAYPCEFNWMVYEPDGSKRVPALIVSGCDTAEAKALAIFSGYGWVVHISKYAPKNCPVKVCAWYITGYFDGYT